MVPDARTDVSLLDLPSAESTFRTVNGVTLHVVAAGDPGDPLVLLLHGFPEFWYEWREYVTSFVDAGYRVLVPDQRGYNLSDKPEGVRAYRLPTLSQDVASLVATEDRERAHVVGHNWGAAVAWDLALRHPDKLDRLAVINVPHPRVIRRALTSNVTQLRKSWYIFYFQLPRIPEWGSRRNDFEYMVQAMQDQARPGAFTDAEMDRYRQAWRKAGALTAMINWYRAMFRYRDIPSRNEIRAPTLVLWGENDQALVPELAPQSLNYCADGRLERFPDATHWLPHEYPQTVTDHLLDHLDQK